MMRSLSNSLILITQNKKEKKIRRDLSLQTAKRRCEINYSNLFVIIFVCSVPVPDYPNRNKCNYTTTTQQHRYKILCANAIKEPCEPLKATQLILDAINLEPDQYRMGLTKVLGYLWVAREMP